MDFYFSRFEHRRPPEPLTTPRWVMFTWQVLGKVRISGEILLG